MEVKEEAGGKKSENTETVVKVKPENIVAVTEVKKSGCCSIY